MKRATAILLKAAAIVFCTVSMFSNVHSASLGLCHCEDWNKDGRFGVVLREPGNAPKVMRPNVGTKNQCRDAARTIAACKTGYCKCEDWNHDGYFGLVKYYDTGGNEVLRPNYGSLHQCNELLRGHPDCR